jgi:hypothetical protein
MLETSKETPLAPFALGLPLAGQSLRDCGTSASATGNRPLASKAAIKASTSEPRTFQWRS